MVTTVTDRQGVTVQTTSLHIWIPEGKRYRCLVCCKKTRSFPKGLIATDTAAAETVWRHLWLSGSLCASQKR